MENTHDGEFYNIYQDQIIEADSSNLNNYQNSNDKYSSDKY